MTNCIHKSQDRAALLDKFYGYSERNLSSPLPFTPPSQATLKTVNIQLTPDNASKILPGLLLELSLESGKKCERVMLVGLHSCGDLSASILQTFAECETISGVICVGCCYSLLTLPQAHPQPYQPYQPYQSHRPFTDQSCGFPMSKFVRNNAKFFNFSYYSMMLACQVVLQAFLIALILINSPLKIGLYLRNLLLNVAKIPVGNISVQC